jgi:hypothetical protein
MANLTKMKIKTKVVFNCIYCSVYNYHDYTLHSFSQINRLYIARCTEQAKGEIWERWRRPPYKLTKRSVTCIYRYIELFNSESFQFLFHDADDVTQEDKNANYMLSIFRQLLLCTENHWNETDCTFKVSITKPIWERFSLQLNKTWNIIF